MCQIQIHDGKTHVQKAFKINNVRVGKRRKDFFSRTSRDYKIYKALKKFARR
jgi:hypothetical protein